MKIKNKDIIYNHETWEKIPRRTAIKLCKSQDLIIFDDYIYGVYNLTNNHRIVKTNYLKLENKRSKNDIINDIVRKYKSVLPSNMDLRVHYYKRTLINKYPLMYNEYLSIHDYLSNNLDHLRYIFVLLMNNEFTDNKINSSDILSIYYLESNETKVNKYQYRYTASYEINSLKYGMIMLFFEKIINIKNDRCYVNISYM